MIYQLLKRDPVWIVAPFYILGCAVAYPLLGSSVARVAFLSTMVGMGTAIAGFQRATRFQAGLPISGRQLLLARVLSILGILWLPALAGGGTILAIRGAASAVTVMKVAAFYTLLIAALQSTRVRELTLPQWLFMLAPMSLIVPSLWVARSFAAIPVLAVCLPLSVVLWVYVWWATPKAYQFAPAGRHHAPVTVRRTEVSSVALPKMPWWPVLHATFSWQHLFFLPWLLMGAMSGQWISGGLVLALMWFQARQRSRWLWSLPINTHAVLLAFLGPILLAVTVGYSAGLLLPKRRIPVLDFNTLVLNLAAFLVWVLIVALCMALYDWRRMGRIPKWGRALPALLLLGGFCVAPYIYFVVAPHTSMLQFMVLQHRAIQHVSAEIPGGLFGAVAVAMATLAALYWALEKVFGEAELTGKPLPPQDFEMFQR